MRRGVTLTIGETMAVVAPMLPEPLQTAVTFRIDAGGAESNVAGHLVQRGHPARWFGRLGDDPLGRRVASTLAARGIDLSAVVYDPEHRTGLYVKDPGGGVHYYRSDSAGSLLSVGDVRALDMTDVAIVHISGITAALSERAADALREAVERGRAAGALVSFDVNHRPALWPPVDAAGTLREIAQSADLVFVGRDEAERVWGLSRPLEVRELLPAPRQLVVKDGAVGATGFEGEESFFVATPPVEVVEEVGAGDAFAGGYLAALLEGVGMLARLRAGHEQAARALRTTGDFPEELT